MLRTIASFYLTFVLGAIVLGQGWRGVRPLHSTCEDVQRALGITKCESGSYDFRDGTVSIIFSDGTCHTGWKASLGTALSLDVHLKRVMRLVDLELDLRKYKKVVDKHYPNMVYYKNDNDGVSVVVRPDGMVTDILYGASAKDAGLRCLGESSSLDQPIGDLETEKVDEYGPLPANKERVRLDAFALRLRAEPDILGYIVAYGGRLSWVGQAKHRAACAKNYLTKKNSIGANRLVTIDGGYQEQEVVALYISLKGAKPPIPFPTLPLREVRIIKGHRRDQRGVCLP